MSTRSNSSQSFNAKAQRKDTAVPPHAALLFSAPWRLGDFALNTVGPEGNAKAQRRRGAKGRRERSAALVPPLLRGSVQNPRNPRLVAMRSSLVLSDGGICCRPSPLRLRVLAPLR